MRIDHLPRAGFTEEVDRLAGALAAAFEDDPVMGWLIPSGTGRLTRLARFFELELRHVVMPVGTAWTIDGATGVALELPPGAWKMSIAVQLAHGPRFMRVFGSRLAHALALITLMEHRHPREPHYYIPYVGVAPSSQGQGLGTALMQPTLDHCDRKRLPVYLEATSARNASLYERLGFRHLGEFKLASGPPLWPMRRPPVA